MASRLIKRLFALGLLTLGVSIACGQNFPNKPLRILAPEAGGGADVMARLIAQGLSGGLGQQVIVENRAGIVANEIVSKALPDGYTLLVNGNSFYIGTLMAKMPYDAVSDFVSISLMTNAPHILVVHPSVPVKSVKELIALAKTKPGELNYGTSGSGSTGHLTAELFKAMSGINIVYVPYKGTAAALNAGVSGEIQLQFASAGATAPHVKSGRLRALGVASLEPSALFPGLPTIASTLPGFQAGTSQGMWGPAKTPAAIVRRLNQEIARYLKTPEAKERLLNVGVEPVGSSPEEAAAAMKSEMARLGKLIKELGIRVD